MSFISTAFIVFDHEKNFHTSITEFITIYGIKVITPLFQPVFEILIHCWKLKCQLKWFFLKKW